MRERLYISGGFQDVLGCLICLQMIVSSCRVSKASGRVAIFRVNGSKFRRGHVTMTSASDLMAPVAMHMPACWVHSRASSSMLTLEEGSFQSSSCSPVLQLVLK